MSREVLHDFDDGHGLTESQRNTLGLWVPDADDGHWVYGQFWENGDYKTGHVIRHAAGADLLSDADGSVNVTIAQGATILETDAKFANKDLRGAIGYIYDGTGEGQTFYIRRMIPDDNDKVEITLLAATTSRPRTPGWATALDNTSKFRLWLPGRFYFSDGAATDLTAGIVQTDLTVTAQYKPFGWAKAEGGAFALRDENGTQFTQNGLVIPLDGGLVNGATVSAANLNLYIGRANFVTVDSAGTADLLAAVDVTNIPRRRPSYSREGEGHSGNTVNVV